MKSKIERSELDVLEEILQEVQENNEFTQKLLADGESQDQEEEKEMTKEDIEYLEKQREKEIQEGIAWIKQREQDTPEEWEKAKEFDKIHDILKPYHKEAEDYSDTLKRVLDDREREGYEKGWDDCERFRILIDRQDEDYDSLTGKERKELARIGKELNKLNSKKK